MNNKPTLQQKVRGLWEFLHRPKTIFDFKDRLKAVVLLAVLSFLVYLLYKALLLAII